MINVSSSIYKFLTDMVYNTADARSIFRFLDDVEILFTFSKQAFNESLAFCNRS